MSEPERSAPSVAPVGVAELVAQRSFLLRLACLQLNEHDAQDAVQETLIAASIRLDRFSGRVAIRAWLTGILRHKVVDLIRQRQRHRSVEAPPAAREQSDGDSLDIELGEMFTEAGEWNPATFVSASCPHEALERRQQLDLLEMCLNLLPESTGRIFLMREYLGMEMEEIATEVALKPGNVRVVLHRARLKLRACLVKSWEDTKP